MSEIVTGGPAFPQDYEHTNVLMAMYESGEISREKLLELSRRASGMTMRDYFAAKAMQALLQSSNTRLSAGFAAFARDSYRMADAMLAAREAKQ